MSRSNAKNIAYLKKLTAKLDELPVFIARKAALYTFEAVVKINVDIGFDSGQAAANWRLEGYSGSPAHGPQKMMWGYKGVEPTSPVGYKLNSKGLEGGVPVEVLSYQLTYAVAQASFVNSSMSGVTVYNPITPGFIGFSPGSDAGYEENAFKGIESKFMSIAMESLARAEDDAKLFLRQKNANPI